MKFVVESITPGMMILSAGTFICSKTFHSCAWRGLAASKEMAWGRAEKAMSRMSASGTSW